MQKNLWTFISYIFHPALMPTLGTFIVLWCDPHLYPLPLIAVGLNLAIVFLCTYLLPLFLSWVLLKIGRISSITDPGENDRNIMLSFTALCFILVYYCFHNIPASGQSLKIFMLGINVSIITTLMACLFTKVSFHAVGVGGLLGTVIGLIDYTYVNLIPWLIGALVIVIITSYSRYKLKAHGAFEIYVGLIIGIAAQSLVFFWEIGG